MRRAAQSDNKSRVCRRWRVETALESRDGTGDSLETKAPGRNFQQRPIADENCSPMWALESRDGTGIGGRRNAVE